MERKHRRATAQDSLAGLLVAVLGLSFRLFMASEPRAPLLGEEVAGNASWAYSRALYAPLERPPLADLLLHLVHSGTSYVGTGHFHQTVGGNYTSFQYSTLRSASAFVSSLAVPTVFFALRASRCEVRSAFVGALLVAADPLLIASSASIDRHGVLQFLAAGVALTFALWRRCPSSAWCVLNGVFCGLLLGADADSFPLVAAAVFFFRGRRAVHGGCVLGTLLIVYAAHYSVCLFKPQDPVPIPWIIEQSLLDRTELQLSPKIPTLLKVIPQTLDMRRTRPNDPFESPWWTWPVFWCQWVPLYERGDRLIVCMGNILVWWPVLAATIANGSHVLLSGGRNSEAGSFFVLYVASLSGYALAKKRFNLVAYEIPLIFSFIGAILFLNEAGSPFLRGLIFPLMGTLAVCGLILWSPLVYGLANSDNHFFVWNTKWINP